MARKKSLGGSRKTSPLQLATFAPDCLEQVYLLACTGMTDEEMCRIFGVSAGKLSIWRRQYKDFDEAIARGRLLPDLKVVESAYRQAVGYEYPKETRTSSYDEDGQSVGVVVKRETVVVPPSASMTQFWMKNRMGDQWKERKEVQVNVVHTLGARLEAALGRIGRAGPASLPAPDSEALEGQLVELEAEDSIPVSAVSDPEAAE